MRGLHFPSRQIRDELFHAPGHLRPKDIVVGSLDKEQRYLNNLFVEETVKYISSDV